MSYRFDFFLEPIDNPSLANLCGPCDEHLRRLERNLGVVISNRGHHFSVTGVKDTGRRTVTVLKELYRSAAQENLSDADISSCLQRHRNDNSPVADNRRDETVFVGQKDIRTRGTRQAEYVRDIRHHDLVFGVGPAGTGKTFLAVALAIEALEQHLVKKLILVRPAVEAGEHLGFLPGDMVQKIDPYLRPIYDALHEIIVPERVEMLMSCGTVEVAPLAYMRGRTISHSFIIMDEAQNTTPKQMKMFLTRIGEGSKVVVTGDVTQADLPRGQESGLSHALRITKNLGGVAHKFFQRGDICRHSLVEFILAAYEKSASDKPS